MNEEKRKNARTQNRFSGGENEFVPRRQDKQSPKMPFTDKNKGEKRKSPMVGSRAQTKIDLQYNEESKYSFKDLETSKKPQELRFREPVFELSDTNNGISRLMYYPDFMKLAEADYYFDILLSSTQWHDKNIVVKGVEYPQPRLVAWYGPHPYTYAGATLEAREMPNAVREIKEKVEATLREYDINIELNSVLLNLYRNEKDSVAWHSDDELSLGMRPTIASISLGTTRKFEMRPKENVKNFDAGDVVYVNLTHGSLIVMDGCMQKDWQHRVPKEYHARKQRINLTFRTIYPLDKLPPEMPCVPNMKSAKSSSEKEMCLQDPTFDSESFPPLGMQASEKKTKVLPKENGNKDCQQSVQRKSPRGNLGASDKKKFLSKDNNDKGYQKSVQSKYPEEEENWDDKMFQNIENTPTIQNKELNCEIINSHDSRPSQIDFNSNIKDTSKACNLQFSSSDTIKNEDYLDSSETYQSQNYEPDCSHWYGTIDPSVPENDLDSSQFDKLGRKNGFQSNSSKTYQSHSCEPVDSHLLKSKDTSPSERKFVKIKSEPIESDAKISDSEKKSLLNANAPDFIPLNKFENYSLFDLAEHFYRLKTEEFHAFKEAICKRLDDNTAQLLNSRDFIELDVYYDLMEDNSLTNKHLKIILKRICSMVKHAYQKLNDPRYMKRYPSRSFSDSNYYNKQSYGRSPRY